MAEFKDRFKALRLEKNLTQDEIAAKFDLTKTAISSYERGKNKPRFEMLDNMADFFDVNIDYPSGSSDVRRPYPRIAPEEWRISIGYHEPTMSVEKWLAIQSHFGHKKIDQTLKHDTPLLKGVLRCKCGRLMGLSRKKHVDGSVVSWYKCYKRERSGECDMAQIKCELLDNKVLEIFQAIDHDPDLIKKYVKQEKKTAGSGDQLKKQIDKLEKKIDRLTESLGEASASAAAKHIVAEIEKQDIELQKLKREEAKVSQEKRRNAKAVKSAQDKHSEITTLLANFDNFTDTEKNEIAKSVIQSATWDGNTLFITL